MLSLIDINEQAVWVNPAQIDLITYDEEYGCTVVSLSSGSFVLTDEEASHLTSRINGGQHDVRH